MDDFKEVIIDTEEIGNFVYSNLIKKGMSPTEDEVYEIAEILFEYLVHKGVIQDVEEWG